MESEIQYCTATDGTRIALTIVGGGSGFPLIYAPSPPFSSVQEPWALWELVLTDTETQPTLGNRPVCYFDFRGSGLSERDAEDFSPEALLSDLEAVAERTGWPKFSLHGRGMSGPIAVLYATKFPEKVTRLILQDTYARAADMGHIPRMRALGAVLRADWESYLDLMCLMIWGWDEPERALKVTEWLSQVSSHESVMALANATAGFDVTGLLQEISVHTLVANPNYMPVPSSEMARAMVARIPNARLFFYGRDELVSLIARMAEFLDEGDEALDEPSLPSGTAIILFADIADSTGLTERLGDEAFREKARSLDTSLRSVVREHDGTPVEGKLLGDGILAVFTSARQAIAAAQRCAVAGAAGDLPLHLGIHAGDVIREDDNVFGGAVNVAARVSDVSKPGEVLVSQTVRDLAQTSAGVSFEERGEQQLKGVSEPVRLFVVREKEESS